MWRPWRPALTPPFSWKKSVIRIVNLRGTIHITQKVQGQLGVTRAKWCDFIVYTGKGIYIERIPFDATYWQNLRTELLQYYFEHFFEICSSRFSKFSWRSLGIKWTFPQNVACFNCAPGVKMHCFNLFQLLVHEKTVFWRISQFIILILFVNYISYK